MGTSLQIVLLPISGEAIEVISRNARNDNMDKLCTTFLCRVSHEKTSFYFQSSFLSDKSTTGEKTPAKHF